ncbi:hypothetical protein TorRG33x02_226190, partial [Trema orientale]
TTGYENSLLWYIAIVPFIMESDCLNATTAVNEKTGQNLGDGLVGDVQLLVNKCGVSSCRLLIREGKK